MVIQRWQSVLLLIAVVMMGLFAFLSLGQVQLEAPTTLNFTSSGFSYEGEPAVGMPSGVLLHTWYFFTLTLLAAILSFIDIFLYKNLTLQIKVGMVLILIIIADIAVAACLGYTAIDGGDVSWSSVAIAPFIALIAVIVAVRCMKSDLRKLAAADRIR